MAALSDWKSILVATSPGHYEDDESSMIMMNTMMRMMMMMMMLMMRGRRIGRMVTMRMIHIVMVIDTEAKQSESFHNL